MYELAFVGDLCPTCAMAGVVVGRVSAGAPQMWEQKRNFLARRRADQKLSEDMNRAFSALEQALKTAWSRSPRGVAQAAEQKLLEDMNRAFSALEQALKTAWSRSPRGAVAQAAERKKAAKKERFRDQQCKNMLKLMETRELLAPKSFNLERTVFVRMEANRRIAKLSPRERAVTEAVAEGATLREIGAEITKTGPEQVRQIYARAVRKMRYLGTPSRETLVQIDD